METKRNYVTGKTGKTVSLTDKEAAAWEKNNIGSLKLADTQPEAAEQVKRVTQTKEPKEKEPKAES